MSKGEDDWGSLVAGVIGAVAGAGITAASLNAQIKNLQAAVNHWQVRASQMQADRDELAGRTQFLENQLRQNKEAEARLRTELGELRRKLEELRPRK